MEEVARGDQNELRWNPNDLRELLFLESGTHPSSRNYPKGFKQDPPSPSISKRTRKSSVWEVSHAFIKLAPSQV
ncbi:hypothetical protein LguiB_028236 [Lonicera macranthoides]